MQKADADTRSKLSNMQKDNKKYIKIYKTNSPKYNSVLFCC